MANSAILSIRIVGDAVDAIKTFDATQKSADAMRSAFDKAAGLSVIALGTIAAAALSMADAASEAEQAAGAVDSVFGASAATIKGYAEDASQAVGLSAQSYNQLASVLGAQLTNMGVAGSELTGQTDGLIGMGADLAAMFGGTTSDAVAALSSLLRGERDPIERYGVSIKQADIDARKAALGLEGLTGEAARNADMQATLAILTEQTASAQGQFSRESDTAAGAQQRMTAEFENAQVALGTALLPILTEVVGWISEFAKWAQDNTEFIGILVGVIGAFAAALVVAQAAQIAMNIAMAANPIGLIVLGIGALIAAIVAVITYWDEICAAIATGAEWLGGIFENIFGWIQDAAKNVGDFFAGVGDFFSGGNSTFTTRTEDASTFSVVPSMDFAPAMAFSAAAPFSMTSTGASAAAYASAPAKAPTQAGDTINVTVNGAIDVDSTARQINGIMQQHNKRSGRPTNTGGSSWR